MFSEPVYEQVGDGSVVASFTVSIGSLPERGAVWLDFRARSTGTVSFSPPSIVWYAVGDDFFILQSKTVTVAISDVVESETVRVTVDVEACDRAFINEDEDYFIDIQVDRATTSSKSNNSKRVSTTTLIIILSLSGFIFCVAALLIVRRLLFTFLRKLVLLRFQASLEKSSMRT